VRFETTDVDAKRLAGSVARRCLGYADVDAKRLAEGYADE